MKFKSVQIKITFLSGLCLLITSAVIIGFASMMMVKDLKSARQKEIREARNQLSTIAGQNAAEIRMEMERALITARTLAQVFSVAQEGQAAATLDRPAVNAILKTILDRNPGYAGVFTCWEPDVLNGLDVDFVNAEGHDQRGRFVPFAQKTARSETALVPFPLRGDKTFLDSYAKAKADGHAFITTPAIRSINQKDAMVVFLVFPISTGDRFFGVAGVELQLDFLQEIADRTDVYKGSAVMTVIGSEGAIAAMTGHPENIGKHIGNILADSEATLEIVQGGEYLIQKEANQLAAYSPVVPGNIDTPWSVRLTVPEDQITGFADARMSEARRGMIVMIVIGVICVIAALGVLQWMSMGIVRPLKRLAEILKDISDGEGDLTRRIEITGQDEIGQAAMHFNSFTARLTGIVKEITDNTKRLNSSSDDLFKLSGKMASGAKNMSDRSDMLAASSEEMSVNSRTVAVSMEQMAGAVATAASAVEQMTSTINEIARNSEKANGITGNAVAIARDATEKVNRLGEAANEIGQVTGVINEISEQTNLLALNATIEAARAGEAGRGFTVVANEIKELARQTTAATQEIREKIDGIRKSTQGTVAEIEEITKVVGQLNEIVSSIAASIEEQSVTTREIAGNISRTSDGIQNVNSNIAHSSDVSEEIARDITGFSLEARAMTGNSDQVNRNAEELRSLSQRLDVLMGRFRV